MSSGRVFFFVEAVYVFVCPECPGRSCREWLSHACNRGSCMSWRAAEGGEENINRFVFCLVSGVESTPFKGFAQFSNGKLVKLFYDLCQIVSSFWSRSNRNPLKIFKASTSIQ